MKNSLDRINEDAMDRFEKLKQKMKLDTIKRLEEDKQVVAKICELTEEEFQEFQKAPEVNEVFKQQTEFVDDSFKFIESLNLPPQLSLAIGYIISHSKTNKIEEISAACQTLEDYIIGKGKEIGAL